MSGMAVEGRDAASAEDRCGKVAVKVPVALKSLAGFIVSFRVGCF